MDSYLRSVPMDQGRSEVPMMGLASRDVGVDPAEAVARIATARRARLLRVHRRRLRWEDLEDCYSQATLELVARARRAPFASNDHVANALEQKFLSRIEDRRRAIGGRSAIESAIARAVAVDGPDSGAVELEDRRAAVESQVIARADLQRLSELIADLSRDQRLVLASQICVDLGVAEFCARFGWSVEKYRKVAQRARAKLRLLVEEYERGERCERLEPDLLAMSAGVADGESLARARAHVTNCSACARMVGDLDRAARTVAALLPPPGAIAIGGGLTVKLGGVWAALRRAASIVRHPLAETGTGGGAGVAGGGVAGLGALKVGLAAVCVAGAAGSYAVCARLGVLPGIGLPRAPAHIAAARQRAGLLRTRHRRRAAAGSTAPAHVSVALAPPPAHVVLHIGATRVSAVVQIRREFGGAVARSASGTGVGGGGSAAAGADGTRVSTSTPSAGAVRTPPATAAQVSETKAEFGFEK
jgi:DNA-directed RNA polymerase specialized sigma24 family protein